MRGWTTLNKPHYLFRPIQVVRRARYGRRRSGHPRTVKLPWGLPIRLRGTDAISSSIARTGVYDLCVSETLVRLIDPGDLVLDVGANIGYMTNLCALRAGPRGNVVSFEPHPDLCRELRTNVSLLNEHPGTASVRVCEVALSSSRGSGVLSMGSEFAVNRGSARLASGGDPLAQSSLEVEVETLDELFPKGTRIGLLKVDVEGQELEVLCGGEGLVRRREIRDIVFEDHRDPPTPVTEHLEGHGYSVLSIGQRLLGPAAHPVDARPAPAPWAARSYLATLEYPRALARLSPRGWRALRPSGFPDRRRARPPV
jgi:FkbM family methyltransferase